MHDINESLQRELHRRAASGAAPTRLIDLELLEGKVIAGLPNFLQVAFHALRDEDADATAWFTHQLETAEEALIKQLQVMVIETIGNCARHEIGLCTCDEEEG